MIFAPLVVNTNIMQMEKIITADTSTEIWQQVRSDFNAENDWLLYNATIKYVGKEILLTIDIDPGGGFEGGFATTSFRSRLAEDPGFHFAVHHQGFLDEIGKFLGFQDVETGYPEFDKQVMVKTDNENLTRLLFADPQARTVFQSLSQFNCSIRENKSGDTTDSYYLELYVEEAITDIPLLANIYDAFLQILTTLENLDHAFRISTN